MEEVVIIPADNIRVCPNPGEATVNVLGGDRVKGAPNIEEGGKAVGSGVNVALNVVDKGKGRSFGRAITAEPVLLGVKGTKPDTLVDVPGAEPLKRLQEVVGVGDRTVGGWLGVGVLSRFGKKNHRTLLPKTGVYRR